MMWKAPVLTYLVVSELASTGMLRGGRRGEHR